MFRIPHAIGHSQAVGSEIAEPATVVAAPRSNQAGRRQEAPPRQNRSARRRVLAVGALVGGRVACSPGTPLPCRSECAAKVARHRLSQARRRAARTHRGRIGCAVRQTTCCPVHGTMRELVCALGESQVDRRSRPPPASGGTAAGRPGDSRPSTRTRQRIRGRRYERRQRQCRRQHMLSETRVRIFWIERVDQQRVTPLDESTRLSVIENGRMQHLARNPALRDRAQKRFIGRESCRVLYNTKYFMSIESKARIWPGNAAPKKEWEALCLPLPIDRACNSSPLPALSHGQHDPESGFSADHLLVGVRRLFQRISLDHGTHAGERAEL